MFLILSVTSKAAEWQWSVSIHNVVSSETNDHPRAFLWIPEDCKQVRAVIVGNHNMLEEGILEHREFRKKMSKLGIAEIWITPGLDQRWDEINKPQLAFDEMMNTLANVSGYEELKFAPIIPIGHSAMATFPWNFAAQNNDRTLAILSVHGDAPSTNLTGYGRPNLDWSKLNIDGIPGLMVEGEYEWWEARVQPGLNYKKAHPKSCISFLCDAGRGHFDFSDQLVDYLGQFIEKAAKFRLPKSTPLNRPVKLIPLNPKNGWLADRWHKDSIPSAKAAPYTDYKGNNENAFWYFDKEMAQKAEQIYARQRGKKEQYIGFNQEGQLLKFNPNLHARINAKFQPQKDGLTFHINAVFTDTLLTKQVTDHAKGKALITRICGPVEKVNDSTFTVRFYHMGLNNPKRTADIWLIASNDGDKTYKSTVQQLNLRIPYPNKEGKVQQIRFDSIPNVYVSEKSVDLHATTDSRLPVYFYVQDGPVVINGNKLTLSKIPPRSKMPIKVTVVAWQYGRSVEPKVQTATPVIRSFYIQNSTHKTTN